MDDFKPLNINIRRGVINGQMKELLTYDEYVNNEDHIDISSTSLLERDKNGDMLALPVKGKLSTGQQPTNPGIYSAGCVDFVVFPEDKDKINYIPSKIIEMDNHTAIKDILEKEDTLSRLSEPWITSPDKITVFPISEDDQPEMVCLKTALNAKEIDFDKYSVRFGENSPNDKRQLKNHSATLKIIKRFCDKCDMEAILILRDKNPKVPNPIGRDIVVSLTENYSDE